MSCNFCAFELEQVFCNRTRIVTSSYVSVSLPRSSHHLTVSAVTVSKGSVFVYFLVAIASFCPRQQYKDKKKHFWSIKPEENLVFVAHRKSKRRTEKYRRSLQICEPLSLLVGKVFRFFVCL